MQYFVLAVWLYRLVFWLDVYVEHLLSAVRGYEAD